jgi:hypothetical protein
VYTVALAAELASVAAIRGLHLARLTREAAREGWRHADLLAVADDDAAAEVARTGPGPPLGRRIILYGVGLAAILAFWLGPKQWGLDRADTIPGLLIELVSLAAPVALGRWLGAGLEAPRKGRSGLLSRFFLRVKAGWFFRLFGAGSPPGRPVVTAPGQPTESLLASQARDLLQALAPAERERLGGALELLGRLEQDAAHLRRRLNDLDEAAAALGGAATPERRAVGASIAAAREDAGGRLRDTVVVLDTVRLELLRARAGLQSAEGLTENLAALRRLSDRIDSSLEANES